MARAGKMTPGDTQILFCDLQPQIIARSKTNPPQALAASASVLAKIGTLLKLPFVFSVVPEGGAEPELIPELRPFTELGMVFSRVSANPFLDVKTLHAVRANGRKTLVIAGFATEVVSLHAAISAIEAGFSVQVPVDANGGMSSRTEDAALRQIERAGGIVTSVVTWATSLSPDFAESPGREVFQALQALRLG